MRSAATLLLLALPAVCLTGCGDSTESPDVDTSRPADFGYQQSVHDALVGEGRRNYTRYCSGCHGVEGDGNGDAAKFLHPKPRNLKLANFKFSSTRSGRLPTDDDLKRTIRYGLKGSAMPSFRLLSEQTLESLVAYVKTLSPKWQQRGEAAPIPRVEDPYRDTKDKSAAIARGEALYHGYNTCWTCHPAYVSEERMNQHVVAFGAPPRPGFRPDLHLSVGKENVEGEFLYPPEFTRDFVRAGTDVDDLYRSIAAGITGTAMPTWVDAMDISGEKEGDPPLVTPADLWALAYYTQHLIQQRPAKLTLGEFEIRERARPIYLHGPPPEVEEEEDDFDEFEDEEDEFEEDEDEA